MTIAVDLPPHLSGRVEADAKAQNRSVADVVRDALSDWYNEDNTEDTETEWPSAQAGLDAGADIYERHPLPASLTQPLAEMLKEGFEAVDAGRVIDGETFLADLHRRAQANRALAARERQSEAKARSVPVRSVAKVGK